MKTKFSFFFAMVCCLLAFSCADLGRDNPNDPGSDKYVPPSSSSSDAGVFGSSSETSSSSLVDAISSSSSDLSSSSLALSSSSSDISSSAQSSSSFVIPSSSSEAPIVPSSSSIDLPSSSSVLPSSSTVELSSSSVQSSSSAHPSSSSETSSSSSVLPSSSDVELLSSSSAAESSSSEVPPSSSSETSSSSSSNLCGNFEDGTQQQHRGMSKNQFCDERDGQIYFYVSIGNQVWMAENLKFNASGSRCYEDNEFDCATYGRLYNWSTALKVSEACNSRLLSVCGATVSDKYQGVCPDGWYLPSATEWTTLNNLSEMKLKTTSGWDISGSDEYGFSALPGGYCGSSNGNCLYVGGWGIWWSSSETDKDYAYSSIIRQGISKVFYDGNKVSLRSVRCLKYNPNPE